MGGGELPGVSLLNEPVASEQLCFSGDTNTLSDMYTPYSLPHTHAPVIHTSTTQTSSTWCYVPSVSSREVRIVGSRGGGLVSNEV